MSKTKQTIQNCLVSYVSVYGLKNIPQDKLNAIINRLNTVEDYIGLAYSIYLANHYDIKHEWNDLHNFISSLTKRLMSVYNVQIFMRNGTCFKRKYSAEIPFTHIFNTVININNYTKLLFNFANESGVCKKLYSVIDDIDDNITIYRFLISTLSLNRIVIGYNEAMRTIKAHFSK